MPKRTCPNGHVVKDRKAIKCPQCGEDLPEVTKRPLWQWIVGALVLLVVCGIIGTAIGGGDKDKPAGETSSSSSSSAKREPAATSTPRPTRTPKPTATPKPITDLSYETLQDNRDSMTDAQWDDYIKDKAGLRVQWSGWVKEAKEKGSAGELLIDMDPPGALFSVQDCYVPIPKDDLLSYNLEQKVTWVGDIKRIYHLLDSVKVNFEDVEVIE